MSWLNSKSEYQFPKPHIGIKMETSELQFYPFFFFLIKYTERNAQEIFDNKKASFRNSFMLLPLQIKHKFPHLIIFLNER